MLIRKELPLAVEENLCHLYLNYQNINSICFQEKHYKNFFFSNYLNCYSVNMDWYKFQYIPDHSMLNSSRYVESKVIDSTIFNKVLDKDEILKFILQSITNDYYIDVYVDEFYLPGTLYFNKEHFPHEQLIFGYDYLSKEMKILSVNKKGNPEKINVNFDLFLETFYILKEEYFKVYNYEQIVHFPFFRLYKSKPEWVDFDIRIVVQQLISYLKSDDVFTLYAPYSVSIPYLYKEHKIFNGISVYGSFKIYIDTLSDDEMINIPFCYGLMEFTNIMKARIQYIFKFSGNMFTNYEKKVIVELFENLVMQHSQLTNMCVKENMRFPKIGNRHKLAEKSEELKNEVSTLYKKVYELIKDIDYKKIMNNNRFYYGVVGETGDLLPKIE